MAENQEERRALAVQLACGMAVGYGSIAAFNAIAFAISTPLSAGGVPLRAAAELFATAETLGVGAVLTSVLFAWLWFVPAPLWVGMGVAGVLGAFALVPVAYVEIYRQACCSVDAEWAEAVLYVIYQLGNGLSFPIALFIGVFFSRHRRLFLAPLVLALAIAVGNQFVQRDDYVSVHGTVSLVLAMLIGAALGPKAEARIRELRQSRGGSRLLYGIGIFTVLGVIVPAPNRVRGEMFRDPATFAPWILASTIWRSPSPRDGTPVPTSAWYKDREDAPETPPTVPRLLAKNPFVVMVTIDATRGEDILDSDHDAMFPIIARLKAEGTTFTNASSAASQTALSLTSTFSGKLYSELRWTYWGRGLTRFHYPHDGHDDALPEILDENGVATAAVSSVIFIDNNYGVFRGIQNEQMVVKGREHAFARNVIDHALEIVRKAGPGPTFLYFHLMEPHAPYDRGSREGTDHERYLSEIAVADRELGRFLKVLDGKFGDRAVVILGADHGEAFGEHQTTQHSKTLYQELIHIPLIIRTPQRREQIVDDRVTLIDMGPTILDIFGLPVPSYFIGQSLVPFLEHKTVALERPILAEGRLRRAITTPDGLKVIDDPRRKLVEAYDLVADPEETDNIWGTDARADEALLQMRTFYANNAYTEGGYSPPYKP